MRTLGAIGLVASALLLVGCTQTVAGSPRGDRNAGGPALSRVLLSESVINDIMGASDMETIESSEDMADTSGKVSDEACLGALYHAEESVYDGTGWTELVDEIVTAPEGYGDDWVEQTVVRMPPEQAADFLSAAKVAWTNCIGKAITVDDYGDKFTWRFEGVAIDDASVSQTARQDDGDGWACRHVLRVANDIVIEVSTCGASLQGEAATIAAEIAANVQ